MNESWILALETLSWVDLRRINIDAALSRAASQLDPEDEGAVDKARVLAYETLKRRNTLDYLAGVALAPAPLSDLDVGVRSFIRLYTYLCHYGGVDYEALNDYAGQTRILLGAKNMEPVEEAVDIIPHLTLPWGEFTWAQETAYKHFHPVWYVEYLQKHFNRETVEALTRPTEIPKYIRVNKLKAGAETITELISQGYPLTEEQNVDAYMLTSPDTRITRSQAYRDGWVILQDKASVLVSQVASPKPTDTVLDVCAAPGVKTSHLAQLMGNQGRIISVDYDERRLGSWRKLTSLMGVTNATPVLGDATKQGGLPDVEADVVILDPPCTGTGTFHSSPSSKWRINQNSVYRMAELQSTLIANASRRLRDGGTLIYSTCSVTLEENEGVIKWFLEENPSFKNVETTPRIGAQGLWGLTGAQRLYPHIHRCQGFFIAKLTKNNALP